MRKEPTKRSVATRRRITEAAAREITLHGFDNLSVQAIAEASGMSVGGIYRYITTKSDLLEMVCKGIYDGVREQLGEIAAGDESLDEKLRAAIDLYLRECEGQRTQIAMMYREYRRLPAEAQRVYMQREQAIVDVFADIVRVGVRKGSFRSVEPAVIAMDIVFLGHLPAFKSWALRDAASAEELRTEQVDLVMNGLQETPA